MTRQYNLFNSRTETGSSALVSMLQTKRPAGSKTERRFIQEWIAPLGTTEDGYGNHLLRIGDVPILWSCHTDTVHNEGGRQKLRLVNNRGIKVDSSCRSNCLGADDTAGVWLMREMILAGRPGLYVFHRAEEIGCKGSGWIADKAPDTLKGIKFAIAFDRKGDDEVITHQGMRSCSDDFAKSLATQLGMKYAPSDRGIYTDTREYTDLVGECTNIGVGYYNQHSRDEWLDVPHILALRLKLLEINAEALVSKRTPGEVEYKTYSYYGGDYDCDGWGGAYGAYSGVSGYYAKDKLIETKADGTKIYSYQIWDRETCKYIEKTYEVKSARSYKSNLPANVQPSNITIVKPTTAKADAGVTKTYRGHNHGGTRHTAFTTRAGDPDDEKKFFSRSNVIKNDFATMERLVRNHPEAVADLLESYNIDANEVADHIYEVLGHIQF